MRRTSIEAGAASRLHLRQLPPKVALRCSFANQISSTPFPFARRNIALRGFSIIFSIPVWQGPRRAGYSRIPRATRTTRVRFAVDADPADRDPRRHAYRCQPCSRVKASMVNSRPSEVRSTPYEEPPRSTKRGEDTIQYSVLTEHITQLQYTTTPAQHRLPTIRSSQRLSKTSAWLSPSPALLLLILLSYNMQATAHPRYSLRIFRGQIAWPAEVLALL